MPRSDLTLETQFMPIYEYHCQSCQHEFEKLQKISDAPLSDCPECHQPALKKKISAAGFRLSGSGWYETDFKKNGTKKNLAGNDGKSSEGASESNKSSESSSDSKSSGDNKNSGDNKSSGDKKSTGSANTASSGSASKE